MFARSLILAGLCMALTGCLFPTPVSIVSSGLDVVSFVASGKTVADHGVSLVAGEDCAMIRILEGELCREAVEYDQVAEQDLLEPLPVSEDPVLLAGAHPEVLAAAERIAAHDGWIANEPATAATPESPRPAEAPQLAMLTGGFVADDISPSGLVLAGSGPEEAIETAPVVLAMAPEPQGVPLAAVVASLEPAAGPAPDLVAEPVVIPRRRPLQSAAPEVLLADAGFVTSAWPETPEPAVAGGSPEREPVFATASYEFGERLTVVRYGSLESLFGQPSERRIAKRRFASTEADG